MNKHEFFNSLNWENGPPIPDESYDFGATPVAIKVPKESHEDEFLIVGNMNLNGGQCECCNTCILSEDIIAHAYLWKE